jgi:hypothetical protein
MLLQYHTVARISHCARLRRTLSAARPCCFGRDAVMTDRNDARGIVQLMRLGWFRPMHCKPMGAQETRAVLTGRTRDLVTGHPSLETIAAALLSVRAVLLRAFNGFEKRVRIMARAVRLHRSDLTMFELGDFDGNARFPLPAVNQSPGLRWMSTYDR